VRAKQLLFITFLCFTDGGELTESYAVENGEVKMSKQELFAMIENAGFEAVERDTIYNRVEKKAA